MKPKIVSKPANKPLLDLDIIEDDIKGNNFSRAKSTRSLIEMNFKERQKHYKEKKKLNTLSLAMEVLGYNQSQCTFRPQVRSNTRRDLKKFLKDQEEFLESRNKRRQDMQLTLIEEQLKTMQEYPKINPKSYIISRYRTNSPNNRKKDTVKEVIVAQPHIKCSSVRSLYKTKFVVTKRKKNIREEHKIQEQDEYNRLTQLKQKVKDDNYIQKKVERELEQLFLIYNIDNSPLTFDTFCIILVRNRQYTYRIWYVKT